MITQCSQRDYILIASSMQMRKRDGTRYLHNGVSSSNAPISFLFFMVKLAMHRETGMNGLMMDGQTDGQTDAIYRKSFQDVITHISLYWFYIG